MKVVGTVLVAAAMLGCGGQFEKISESDVDAQQKAVAERLASRIYEGCRSGTHQPLAEDEAIPAMRDALSPAKLAGTCASINAQFGDYQSLEYAETWKQGSGSLRVYRFKGHFARAAAPPEVRVVMDGTKLSGFWLKPWADALR